MLEQHGAEADGTANGRPQVTIEHATWLGPSALVLVGSLQGATAIVRAGGERRRLHARPLEVGDTEVLVVALPDLESLLGGDGILELAVGEGAVDLPMEQLKGAVTDLQTLVRRSLAALDPPGRNRVAEFLAETLDSVPRRERAALSKRLIAVREALRERLPACVISESQSRGLHLDQVLAVDDRSFYLEGWLHDEDMSVTRVTAVSPEGSRAEVLERMYRTARPDVASFFSSHTDAPRTKHGFHCFIELDAPSLAGEGWLLEMETVDGDAVEVSGPPVTRDTIAVRDTILRDPHHDRLPNDELMVDHVYPAISRIQSHIGDGKIARVVQFGTPPTKADVSIVVPVYKRLDHLEMQLSEFVSDPEISQADLIYVLDSPELEDEFLDRAIQLTPLYRIPFRVAVLERNVGFAGANNAGASIAEGRLMLLLNSDILPDRPGWLSRMREFYDSVPHIGALGVKLLFEDDSIQHAGMYFFQPPGTSVWQDAHYFKGMHRSLPAANVARSVPLVSGACMMIDRTLYQQLGGLRGIFVRGDYEDSDLCLQLTESGRENWYLPDVELYHLEGQSYSATPEQSNDRYLANRYNMWVHSHIWRDRILEIMRELDRAESAGSP